MKGSGAVKGWLLCLLLLTGCAGLAEVDDLVKNRQPTVKVSHAKLTGLDFQQVELNLGLTIQNPNPLAIQLAGLDYSLEIAGTPFLTGEENKDLQLVAHGSRQIDLPLRLVFQDLIDGYTASETMGDTPYEVKVGLIFQVPILGLLRVPISHSGQLPVLRMPTVSVETLALDQLKLSGADLRLVLQVDNKNDLAFQLQSLNYQLAVNGQKWAMGHVKKPVLLAKQGQYPLTIPISLNFLEMGTRLYSWLKKGEPLSYQFNAELAGQGDHPLLKPFKIPLNSSGTIPLSQ